jgi:hypothetical protein
VAAPGASAEVAGKSSDGLWWQVKIPTSFAPDGLGWVSAGYVTTANSSAVPTVATTPCSEVPPPPQAATYNCLLSAQDPEDNPVMEPGSSFTLAWTIQNTGGSAWTDADSARPRLGGFHTGPDSIDTAPSPGRYIRHPALALGAGTFGEVWEAGGRGAGLGVT